MRRLRRAREASLRYLRASAPLHRLCGHALDAVRRTGSFNAPSAIRSPSPPRDGSGSPLTAWSAPSRSETNPAASSRRTKIEESVALCETMAELMARYIHPDMGARCDDHLRARNYGSAKKAGSTTPSFSRRRRRAGSASRRSSFSPARAAATNESLEGEAASRT